MDARTLDERFALGGEQALADAIEELARNSSLRKIMAAKGRRVAEEQFDQPHSYQTIVDLIRKLI